MKLDPKRLALWLIVLGLAFAPLFTSGRDNSPEPTTGLVERLFGPFSELAARVQWVRVQQAVLEGSSVLALARAETALKLDPSATDGWRFVAVYLGLDLASPNREPNPERRRELLVAGLDVLERGVASARSPEQLRFWAGILLMTHAETDPELDWPGGAHELWRAAATAFEGAAELGFEDATDLAELARTKAQAGD